MAPESRRREPRFRFADWPARRAAPRCAPAAPAFARGPKDSPHRRKNPWSWPVVPRAGTTCRQRILSEALCALCQLDLPRQVVWLEPSDPLPTKQRVIVAPRRYEKLAGLVVLLDRFVRSILPLQQEGVARNALGGLLCRNGTKKPVVDGQRFAFILRIDQQIKQHAVIHGSAVGLVDARIEITQGLRRFLMLGCFPEHREIRFDGILDTILLKEALRAIQMLVDVCGHSFEMPLRFLKAA